jgi:hypothetical protein
VPDVPRAGARETRERVGVHRVPPAAPRRRRRESRHLHVVPPIRRRRRSKCPRWTCRMHDLPQAARFPCRSPRPALRRLPRQASDARRRQPRAPRMRVVPRLVGASPREGTRLRQLPWSRARQRAGRTQEVRELPRITRRLARPHGRDVCELPREKVDGAPRFDPGQLRELPSLARPKGSVRSAAVLELPREAEAAGAARVELARPMRAVPHLARSSACRSSDLHGGLPHEPEDAPADRQGLQRLPRLPKLSSIWREPPPARCRARTRGSSPRRSIPVLPTSCPQTLRPAPQTLRRMRRRTRFGRVRWGHVSC